MVQLQPEEIQSMLKVIQQYSAFQNDSLNSLSISALGHGLINQTWLVRNTRQQAMVLQRLNTHVFPEPWDVIENAQKIGEHLQLSIENGQYLESAVKPVLTLSGEAAIENDGGFWRAIHFFSHSIAYDKALNLNQVEQAAAAYARFSCALSTISADTLKEVIPYFHHLPARLSQLEQAVADSNEHRREQCRYWLEFVGTQSELSEQLLALLPKLPRRVVHNDTKLNNLLFDKRTASPLAVIDLDTCMPGYLMYDFGDMVRSMCASQAEDMQKFDDIYIKPDAFAAVAKGYMSGLSGVMTPVERDSLWLGVKAVPLELAVRFLTDYLNGDIYFHIEHGEHNLERARNQFALYQSLLAQEQVLKNLLPEL